MKQYDIFSNEFTDNNNNQLNYTKKIEAPIYEPSLKKPNINELVDISQYLKLKREIEISNVSEAEKKFLYQAATRHLKFNYSKIADYYAHSNKEMQQLIERSALVIIDFEQAIQLGYVKLSEEITQQYLRENE